jgi:hypothetical protein
VTYFLRRILSVVVLGLALGGAAASTGGAADPANEQVFEYQIKHPIFGDIGTYINAVKTMAGKTEVSTTVQVAVNVAGTLIFRQDAARRENWDGDRLVAFTSVTQTNEERLEVRGQARDGSFIVTSPQGSVVAPATVRPSNPWSMAIVKSDMMLAPMSGRLFRAQITNHEETIRLQDGRTRKLRRYEILGDKRQVVWFDEGGVPLAFRSEEGGVNIDFVLSKSRAGTPGSGARP